MKHVMIALIFLSCGDGKRGRLPIEEVPNDFAFIYYLDDMGKGGRCGNGDSPPDSMLGYCPCCETRDDMCNIPIDYGKWCDSCLLYEHTNGREGSLFPCRTPIP